VSVLLPLGITPKTFSKIAREAYVCAAAAKSRLRSGKVNYSKVAALTGLPRADIKRILSQATNGVGRDDRARTPSERVVKGWLTDRRFCTLQGNPKSLVISGAATSFQRLVKEYGGDISARAVLDELIGAKLARSVEGKVVLKISKPVQRKTRLGTLARLIPTLVDSFKIAAHKPESAIDSSFYRLALPASTDADLRLIRERCMTSIRSLLYGLKESLELQPSQPAGNRLPKHLLTVSVLLAEIDLGGS
jgi:hypothetical protein